MAPYWSEEWANPSAIYKAGVRARAAIEHARTELARILRVRAHDIVFTSGGTESNNLALWGVIEARVAAGYAYTDIEVITTRMEHPSILGVLSRFEHKGVHITYVDVNEEGCIDEHDLAAKLTEKTVLVTFAYANSEVGVVQEVKHVTRLVKKYNQAHGTAILVHLDASQAPLWLSCEMDMLAVDLMTLDAGKCYGPKGVGVLAYRHGVILAPFLIGGDQENGLRAGTENVALVVGCVAALVRAQASWRSRSEAVAVLRDRTIALLEAAIPACILNGSRTKRIANNINISLPGFDTEYAVITLDAAGIAASTKSACGGKKGNGSEVVRTLTRDEARAHATLRFTLGEETTIDDLETLVHVLKNHLEKMERFQKTLVQAKV
jgi:cysteine desulfurase